MTGRPPSPRWASPFDPPRPAVVGAVGRALDEDLLPLGDLTADLVPADLVAEVVVASRADGVLAGGACAAETLARVDPLIDAEWEAVDGDVLAPGQRVATLRGPLRSVLTAERTALNFLGHLSGVATLTRRYVDAVRAANPACRVIDTRKTTPGLRSLEKAAVRAGGGHNHRGNLSEAVLVKDNHLGGLSIADAVARARSRWPGRMVEVECDRLDQVAEAADAGASVIMLDNMDADGVRAAVGLVRERGSAALLEVSGGLDLERAPRMAACGVDLLSVGALTHSAPVLDLGFDLPDG